MTPTDARDVVSRLTASLPRLSEPEFERFRALVLDHTGISLGAHGRALLQTRLGRRLRALGLTTFAEYLRHLTAHDVTGEELARFVNAVTTNKTEFFREAHHFRYLADVWAPPVRARLGRDGPRAIRFWSAGCSSGEEAYTIALTLHEALGPDGLSDLKILASDIDTDMLTRVEAGIYSTEQVGPIPPAMLTQHFLRGTATKQGLVRVRPELRSLVTARRINLLEDPWPIKTRFDVIFCRNVLIYFDRATQQRVIERLVSYLVDDGLLILGHSESVLGLLGGLVPVENTVYRRAKATDGQRPKPSRPPRAPAAPAKPAPTGAPDAAGDVKEVTLYIGGMHAAADPTTIKTLVGSCVAACLWDPVARVGGMNHFLLPSGNARGDETTRFGGFAMDRLIAETVKAGGARQRFVAKVFGGARILDFGGSGPGVDRRNIEFIREYLEREGFPVVAADVGGSSPRQIHFDTATGRARVKRVSAPTAGTGAAPVARRRA